MPTPEPPPIAPVAEDRTVAILSYITLIGFIIAIVMHNGKKTRLGAFHLRQMLGMFIAYAVVGVGCVIVGMIPLIGLLVLIIGPLVFLFLFVLWLMGLIAAASGQQTPMPVLGPLFQKWFANAFN